MGAQLSRIGWNRVGSGNFYASYERNFEQLKTHIAKLKAHQLETQRRRQRISSTILTYSCALFAVFFAFAAWVTRQEPSTYSVRGHFLRVVPVFTWPPAAWLLHASTMYLTSWKAGRDAGRLQRAEARMRKMLTDLKDSTHYDKTLELLRKYDPDFAAAEAKQRARLRAQSPVPAQRPVTPLQGAATPQQGGSVSPLQLGGLVGSGIRGAGSRMMPALDYLATSLIGDNPALTGALREARSEGEALRLRLARAEARVFTLQAANAALRERLGEPPEPGSSPSAASDRQQNPNQHPLSAPPTPTSMAAAVRAQELLEAAAAASVASPGADGGGRPSGEVLDDSAGAGSLKESGSDEAAIAKAARSAFSGEGTNKTDAGGSPEVGNEGSALSEASILRPEPSFAAPLLRAERSGDGSAGERGKAWPGEDGRRSRGSHDEGFEFRSRRRLAGSSEAD